MKDTAAILEAFEKKNAQSRQSTKSSIWEHSHRKKDGTKDKFTAAASKANYADSLLIEKHLQIKSLMIQI